jgi:hypothetical protein
LQLAIPAFPDFLLLERRDAVATLFTQVSNFCSFAIPIVPTGHILPRARVLSCGEMAYDASLIFDGVGIELG